MKLEWIALADILQIDPAPTSAAVQRSLMSEGQKVPVILERVSGGYVIQAGRRRVANLAAAGATALWAIVKEPNETSVRDANVTGLIENMGRSSNPMNEARMIAWLMADHYDDAGLLTHAAMSVMDIVRATGGNQGAISQRKALNNLLPELQVMLEAGAMTFTAARNVCKLDEEGQRRFLASGAFTVKAAKVALADYQSDTALGDIEMPDLADVTGVDVPSVPGLYLSSDEMARMVAGEPIEVEWNGKVVKVSLVKG